MPSIDVLRDLRTNQADGFRRGLDLGLRTGFGSDWLGIAAQKVVLDGGMQVETARMTTPVRGHRERGCVAAGPAGDARGDRRRSSRRLADGAARDRRRRPRPGHRGPREGAGGLATAGCAAPHRARRGDPGRPAAAARRAGRDGRVTAVVPLRLRRPLRLPARVRADPLALPRPVAAHARDPTGRQHGPAAAGHARCASIQTLVDRTSNSGQVIARTSASTSPRPSRPSPSTPRGRSRREDRLGRLAERYLADLTLLARNPLRRRSHASRRSPCSARSSTDRTWLA